MERAPRTVVLAGHGTSAMAQKAARGAIYPFDYDLEEETSCISLKFDWLAFCETNRKGMAFLLSLLARPSLSPFACASRLPARLFDSPIPGQFSFPLPFAETGAHPARRKQG